MAPPITGHDAISRYDMQIQCLAWALENGVADDVWGGHAG